MPDINIKYEKGIVEQKVSEIESNIQSLLIDKASEYDTILENFSVSDCSHADSVREQLRAEKDAVNSLATFYQKTLMMIMAASHDVDMVEEHYGKEHVSGG